eukprot:gene16579-biopygen15832
MEEIECTSKGNCPMFGELPTSTCFLPPVCSCDLYQLVIIYWGGGLVPKATNGGALQVDGPPTDPRRAPDESPTGPRRIPNGPPTGPDGPPTEFRRTPTGPRRPPTGPRRGPGVTPTEHHSPD